MSYDCCVLLEPDGIGSYGHYVNWHNQLGNALKDSGERILILCNKKQHINNYSERAINTFTFHSWDVSRKAASFDVNFMEMAEFKIFKSELIAELKNICESESIKNIKLFIYYGSTQVLWMLHEVKNEFKNIDINIDISLCMFHESVVFNESVSEPKFPPNSREIFLKATEKSGCNLLAVTNNLSDHLLSKFDVNTRILPNPVPALCDKEFSSIKNRKSAPVKNRRVVFFPCSLRDEKGAGITKNFLSYIRGNHKNDSIEYLFKGGVWQQGDDELNIHHISDYVNDNDYRNSINKSDIIVIPYLSPSFKYRTSGILVDALAAGKPCIVINNTWLSDVINKYNAGLSIKYISHFTILSAIRVIEKSHDFFTQNAIYGFYDYFRNNSWKSTANVILNN
jgi:glycosyltransferase involved in cell wall biosynthesis